MRSLNRVFILFSNDIVVVVAAPAAAAAGNSDTDSHVSVYIN